MTPDPLLQAIIAEPDDDTPRLVYADWLEEHGKQDRAEFIRVQCELARLHSSDRRQLRLTRRMQFLLRQHGKEWAGALNRLTEGHVGFVRGFVNEVEVKPQVFLDHMPEFFDRHPLRVIQFRRVGPGHVSAIAACPQLARLNDLRFDGGMGPGEGAILARSPFLAGLQALRIQRGAFGPDGLTALASSHLSRLCDLELVGTDVGTAGVEALARSQRLPQLRYLGLSESAVGDRGVEALAGGPLLGQLISLSLGYNPIGDAAAAALARSTHLQHLERLNLTKTRITAAGFEALASCSHLSALRVLNLGDDSGRIFPPAGLRYLAQSPHLGALEQLSFDWAHVGDEGAWELAGARWRRLHTLYLGHCGIGNAGLRALSESPVLGAVTRLWLWENRIGDEGALALAKSPYLTNLKDLDLRGNQISKEARQILRDRFGKHHCRLTR